MSASGLRQWTVDYSVVNMFCALVCGLWRTDSVAPHILIGLQLFTNHCFCIYFRAKSRLKLSESFWSEEKEFRVIANRILFGADVLLVNISRHFWSNL